MPEVMRTIEIAAAPATVWKWFSSEEALREWWGTPDLAIDLEIGGAFSLTGQDGATRITGYVLELDAERRLVLSWFEEGTGWIHPARLLFVLEASGAGTRVTLQHDGFAGIGTASWRDTEAAYELGSDRHELLAALAALVAADAGD